ncbi:MAG TPA: hypothetical protein VHI13_18160 [Candidatus Kapabacteria bacterium]|nr:hypothetical protein [Candidatus Kapabacteria bacterium]
MVFGSETEVVPTSVESSIPLNATVGVPFTISLPLVAASEMPGPVWLERYDSNYLLVSECGYSNDYSGNQFFWVRFIPTAAGVANASFVQQQRLINPLFIGIQYQITITS